jgi:hypothetical protein
LRAVFTIKYIASNHEFNPIARAAQSFKHRHQLAAFFFLLEATNIKMLLEAGETLKGRKRGWCQFAVKM